MGPVTPALAEKLIRSGKEVRSTKVDQNVTQSERNYDENMTIEKFLQGLKYLPGLPLFRSGDSVGPAITWS
jgi:hypothetical protein